MERKEAIVVIKKNYPDSSLTMLREAPETLIPELKESEDEKTRACIEMCLTDIDEQRFADFNTNLKECLDWLKKQGEQKPQGKTALEAIKEEKIDNANKLDNTYKDGLRFHIGDWVVTNNTKIVFLIKSYNSGYYTLEDINGNTYSSCIAPTEEDYHLWTLKDARDGDILASKSGDKIFSYRGSLDLRGNPCAYYGIYKVHDGICFSPCAIGNSFTCEGVFPATKEQRKTLFEEMTAAKGVLHFNKKELKKIEQKEVIHNGLTEFEKAVKQVMEEAIECGDTRNLKADAEMLLSLVQKPAWSEEDKKMFLDIDCLIHSYRTGSYEHELSSWLEHLKDRVQPQNTWKPSDEQIKQLGLIAKQNKDNMIGKELMTLFNDLKKLMEE